MATKDRKRQKHAAKKRQKSLARKKTLTLRAQAGAQLARDRIHHARNLPIHECLITRDWRDSDMALVVLARRVRDDRLVVTTYLVDLYCLGLKDTMFFPNKGIPEYKAMLRKVFRSAPPVKCSPELAQILVYGAIEYAARFGFQPHKDFRITQHALGPNDSPTIPIDVTFGHNGKPFFVAGPNDNVRKIVQQLERATGGCAGETFDILVRM